MLPTELPTRPEDLSLEVLNKVIAAHRPNVVLVDYKITESHVWGGGQASSAGRIVIEPTYSTNSPELPKHIVVKVAKSTPGEQRDPNQGGSGSGQLYANEVNVYNHLRPAEFLESPLTLGGQFDPHTTTFMLLLEDLRDRDAVFATIKMPTSIRRIRSLIDQLSSLHARYWNSPHFGSSLNWIESHTRGAIHDLFTSTRVAQFAEYQVATEQIKQEMLQRMGVSPQELFEQFQRVQQHQATLPQTICHGDAHIANTYILPDDSAGLLDWQLASQGYAMHDICYAIVTSLSIADRRANERDLLAYYREQLRSKGVTDVPSLDDLWLEYRRAMVWNVYIGWLITPVINYGLDISTMALLRTMTAYEDVETRKSLAEL